MGKDNFPNLMLWHLLVDYRGEKCNDEKQYSRDLCASKLEENEYLNKVGCTTVFAQDKNKICHTYDEVNAAMEIFIKNSNNYFYYSRNCSFPCSIFTFTTLDYYDSNNMINQSSTRVSIWFEEIIKVTRDYYTYTEISLIAEIGGYVGLFLGVSINQVTNLMDFIVLKMYNFMTK